MLLEWIEVPIAMEKGMALRQAVGCNQAVDSLANRKPLRSKKTIVSCRVDREIFSSGVEDLEFGHAPPHLSEGRVTSNSLQDLAQNKIRYAEALLIQLSV
jgi:hypothetical protein